MNAKSSQASPQPSAQVKDFAKRLGSSSPQERTEAEYQIQEMGDAGRDLLIALMRYEDSLRRERRNERGKMAFFIICLGLTGGLLHLLRTGHFTFPSVFIGQLTVSLVMYAMYHFWSSQARLNAALLLAKHYNGVVIVGPLAEALTFRSKAVRDAAEVALTQLLSQVQEGEEVPLTPYQRDCLYSALMHNNAHLVLAILTGLQHIGDSNALPNVQRLAAGQGAAGVNMNVREVAQRTLLCLRQKLEAERAPQTLLRAASAVNTQSDELMRPASGVYDTQKQVLLRAASDVVETTP